MISTKQVKKALTQMEKAEKAWRKAQANFKRAIGGSSPKDPAEKPGKVRKKSKPGKKLTKKQVANIKWLKVNTAMSDLDLAKKFHTTGSNIYQIRKGVTHKDVKPVEPLKY